MVSLYYGATIAWLSMQSSLSFDQLHWFRCLVQGWNSADVICR